MSRVGHILPVSTEPKWRCDVCTFLNAMQIESCKRCHEPTTKEQRDRLRIRVGSCGPPVARQRSVLSKSSTENRGVLRKSRQGTGSVDSHASSSSSRSSRSSRSSQSSTSTSSRAPRQSVPVQRRKSGVHTLSGKKKSVSTRQRVKQYQHKGDLGYKPTLPRNQVHSFARSRLKEATASYAAKYADDGGGGGDSGKKRRRSANIHTIGQSTVNGLTKSSAAMKRERDVVAKRHVNPHDEKRASAPAKYRFGSLSSTSKQKRQGGLIGRLQSMASVGQVASLKHSGAQVRSSKKNMGNGVSSLNL